MNAPDIKYNPFRAAAQAAFSELSSDSAHRYYSLKAQKDVQNVLDTSITLYAWIYQLAELTYMMGLQCRTWCDAPDSKLVCVAEFAHSPAIERGSNEEIFKPVVVISKAIKVSKGRAGKSAVPLDLLAVRMKIPQQSHRHYSQTCRVIRAMKILHLIEDAVLIVDQAVNLITGSVSLWSIKGKFELSCLGLECHQLFKDDFMRHIGACPFLKSS